MAGSQYSTDEFIMFVKAWEMQFLASERSQIAICSWRFSLQDSLLEGLHCVSRLPAEFALSAAVQCGLQL